MLRVEQLDGPRSVVNATIAQLIGRGWVGRDSNGKVKVRPTVTFPAELVLALRGHA